MVPGQGYGYRVGIRLGLIREFDAHVENGTANIFPIFEEIGALEGAKTPRPSRTSPLASSRASG